MIISESGDQSKIHKPVPITVVAFVNFAGAAATIVFLVTDFTAVIPVQLDVLFSLLALGACVLGWGLLKLQNWARIGTVLFMAFVGIGSVVGLIGTFKSLNVVIMLFFLCQVTVQGTIIAYLVHPHARKFFDVEPVTLNLK